MKTIPILLCSAAILFMPVRTLQAQPASTAPSSAVPPVIDAGFVTWTKSGPAFALDLWQKGGLLEGTPKIGALAKYFKRIEPTVGGFKSYELVDARKISPSSQLVYVALNFERGAVYGRFLLYRIEDNWVTQNLDFNIRPELVIPWLAFAGAADLPE